VLVSGPAAFVPALPLVRRSETPPQILVVKLFMSADIISKRLIQRRACKQSAFLLVGRLLARAALYRQRLRVIAIMFAATLAAISVHAQNANSLATNEAKNPVVDQLKQATQELLDAVASGDVAVWRKYLAEGCIYTDEEGAVKTREDLLSELKPLPKGYVGSIKMGEPKVSAQENVIVLSHRDGEELELYGQKLITWFHSTDTWAKSKDGKWRLVAVQVMAVPNERKPIAVGTKKLDEYAGQYQLAPDVAYTVTRDGDKLFGQRTGRAKEELLPLYEDVFYRKGVWRGEKVFERDAKGRVVRMLDRRENNDLVWTKAK
jgi:hypothetical protein